MFFHVYNFCCCYIIHFVIIFIDYFIEKKKEIETRVSKPQSSTKKWETEVKRKMTHFTGVYPNICVSPALSVCVLVYILSGKSFKFIPSNTLPLLHSYLCELRVLCITGLWVLLLLFVLTVCLYRFLFLLFIVDSVCLFDYIFAELSSVSEWSEWVVVM